MGAAIERFLCDNSEAKRDYWCQSGTGHGVLRFLPPPLLHNVPAVCAWEAEIRMEEILRRAEIPLAIAKKCFFLPCKTVMTIWFLIRSGRTRYQLSLSAEGPKYTHKHTYIYMVPVCGKGRNTSVLKKLLINAHLTCRELKLLCNLHSSFFQAQTFL